MTDVYEPKVGDVVRLRAEYVVKMRDQGRPSPHGAVIGIVTSAASLEPLQSERKTWMVKFFAGAQIPGNGSWNYHVDDIEPLPFGTGIILSTMDVVASYAGIDEPYPIRGTKENGCTAALRVRWNSGRESALVLDSNVFLVDRIPVVGGLFSYVKQHLNSPIVRVAGTLLRWEAESARYVRVNAPKKSPGIIAEPAAKTGLSFGEQLKPSQHYCTAGASCAQLAWLMFCTDSRVKDFAVQRSECLAEVPITLDGHSDRYLRVLRIAWGRDEQGWRTEFTQKAKAMAELNIHHESRWAIPESA